MTARALARVYVRLLGLFLAAQGAEFLLLGVGNLLEHSGSLRLHPQELLFTTGPALLLLVLSWLILRMASRGREEQTGELHATPLPLTRGHLRGFGFALIASVATLEFMRLGLGAALPALPERTRVVAGGPFGAVLRGMLDPTVQNPSAWIPWALGGYALLALGLFIGPPRILQLARGLRPRPRPWDTTPLAQADPARALGAAAALWFCLSAVMIPCPFVLGGALDPAFFVTHFPWVAAATACARLVVAWLFARMAWRDSTSRNPACLIGLELAAATLLLLAIPSAADLLASLTSQDTSNSAPQADTHVALTFGLGLITCLGILIWAQYRRGRTGAP